MLIEDAVNSPNQQELSLEERVQLLAVVPLFAGLTPRQLRPIAVATTVITFEPGDYLVRQGDPGDSVYVILDGRVDVLAYSGDSGAGVAISSLSAGDAVGELALLDGKPRSASCVALTRTTCLRLARGAFVEAARRHWTLSQALFAILADRLRYSDRRLAEHARDPLTGLYNRRALHEHFERERARHRPLPHGEDHRRHAGTATHPRFAVLFADVDHFKQINDRFGHATGDDVLCAVGRVLTATLRSSDVVARYGGDEFVALLPDTEEAAATRAAARVADAFVSQPPGPVPFTVSIGVAAVEVEEGGPGLPDLEALLAIADADMYRHKNLRSTPSLS